MERVEEIGLGNKGKNNDGFIDRSKVRILLCDNDAKSLEEAFTLLCKCSYQVNSVRSPRQVIDALNAEGPDIDLILSEVDLPMAKGMKMLKYITRDKELRRIPVIMMSAQDEISVVVKCLRLGAADYLVKPLRTNELLNLWTHMWRRRRMLGLAEKTMLYYDFDLVASDLSDPNTTSTTLLSDDTDDKSKKNTNPLLGVSRLQEDESIAGGSMEPPDSQPDVPGIIDHQTGPKKSELKIGKSSAFFTYVKSSMIKNGTLQGPFLVENAAQEFRTEENLQAWRKEVDNIINGDAWENHSRGDDMPSSNSLPESLSMERSCTPPRALEYPQQRNSKEADPSHMLIHRNNKHQIKVSDFPPHSSYQYYMPQMPNDAPPAMLSQYNFPQYHPQVGGMTSFPYYPPSLCLQPGQMPSSHPWPSIGGSPSTEVKLGKVDRREAALIKFRQKRKERCFDKKIRYVNRKQLAERRPRMRGQFARKVNGVNVDLNGKPDVDFNEDEEEEYDEGASRNLFAEDDGAGCQY